MWDDALSNIIDCIETELLDSELAKARRHLAVITSPEEYWMEQGKLVLLKQLKEKLHSNSDNNNNDI